MSWAPVAWPPSTGVLVALAVDAWVERRQERRLEASYLVRLEEELREDSARIQTGYTAIQRYFLNETLTSGDSLLVILRGRRK